MKAAALVGRHRRQPPAIAYCPTPGPLLRNPRTVAAAVHQIATARRLVGFRTNPRPTNVQTPAPAVCILCRAQLAAGAMHRCERGIDYLRSTA